LSSNVSTTYHDINIDPSLQLQEKRG